MLLNSLCAGAEADELPAAISGLLAASASVRAAALAALPSVPLLAAGKCPADAAVAAVLWLARFDASPGEWQMGETNRMYSAASLECQAQPSAINGTRCCAAALT